MAHDATKVLLGTTKSNVKTVINKAGTREAGLFLRLKSDDTLSLAKSDGELLGVSLGVDMSDTSRTAIVAEGLMVPVLLTTGLTPVVGAQVNVSDTTGLAIAAGGGATAVNATYATAALTGIKEDGVTTANVAYINFVGGL